MEGELPLVDHRRAAATPPTLLCHCRATRNYLFQFDATSWGWIDLLVGLIVVMTGFAIPAGRTWGRVVGITLAMVSALANFLFIPCYPFWGADCHRPGHS